MPAQNVRFGVFRVDLKTAELFNNGSKVPLQEQPFQVLKLLLGHPGEVVSREEIRRTLWSDDTIVEFDNSVHAAIKKLRMALGDSSENPTYIETLPRKGYRFIFPLEASGSDGSNTRSLRVAELVEGSKVAPQDPERASTLALPALQENPQGRVQVEAPSVAELVIGLSETAADLEGDLKRLKRHLEIEADSGRLDLAILGLKQDSESISGTGDVPKPKSHTILWGTASLLLALTAAAIWLLQPTAESPIPVPLVAYPGIALDPSFSPDGNQIVFTWEGDKQENLGIYVKQIGSESLRRLTTEPQADASAAWSPDGRFIAFLRYFGSGKRAVMLIPANGGRERQVAELRTLEDLFEGRILCWHPSGKWLAVASASQGDSYAIHLISPDTGEKRKLTSPPKGSWGDKYPAFSPDGRNLVFARAMAGTSELYVLRVTTGLLSEGDPKQLTFSNKVSINPAWTPDGKEIIYASGSQPQHCILWRISASGSGKSKPLPFSSEGTADRPAISLLNHRLAYITGGHSEINIWRCQIPLGRTTSAPPSNFMASTRGQELAQYSPDGRTVAYVGYVFGSAEIWVCDRDGTNPLQLTHLGGPSPNLLHWSPDGKSIVFGTASKGQTDLFIVPAQIGQIRQLTDTPFNERNPSYSRDGKWIYFDSDRVGDFQVWKIPVEGGEQIQVTQKGGSNPLESMDGKTLFYLKPKQPPDYDELWKVPVQRGEESRVLEQVLTANFDVKERGIYYAYATGPPLSREGTQFLFYDYATGKTKHIATIEKLVWSGFTVSPDEQWILYTQGQGDANNDLMLVENFQ